MEAPESLRGQLLKCPKCGLHQNVKKTGLSKPIIIIISVVLTLLISFPFISEYYNIEGLKSGVELEKKMAERRQKQFTITEELVDKIVAADKTANAIIAIAHLRHEATEKSILTIPPDKFQQYCSIKNIILVEKARSKDDPCWADYDWYPNGLSENPSDIDIRINWLTQGRNGYYVSDIMICNLKPDDSVEAAKPVLAFWNLFLPDIVPLFIILKDTYSYGYSDYYWYKDTPYVFKIEANNKRFLKHLTRLSGMPDRKILQIKNR